MAVSTRKPSNKDVELARIRSRAELHRRLVAGASPVFTVLASALPIWVLGKAIKPLAGHTTIVDVKFAFTVTVVLSLTVNTLQYGKGKAQKSEIKRLRRRSEELEAQLLRSR